MFLWGDEACRKGGVCWRRGSGGGKEVGKAETLLQGREGGNRILGACSAGMPCHRIGRRTCETDTPVRQTRPRDPGQPGKTLGVLSTPG